MSVPLKWVVAVVLLYPLSTPMVEPDNECTNIISLSILIMSPGTITEPVIVSTSSVASKVSSKLEVESTIEFVTLLS